MFASGHVRLDIVHSFFLIPMLPDELFVFRNPLVVRFDESIHGRRRLTAGVGQSELLGSLHNQRTVLRSSYSLKEPVLFVVRHAGGYVRPPASHAEEHDPDDERQDCFFSSHW